MTSVAAAAQIVQLVPKAARFVMHTEMCPAEASSFEDDGELSITATAVAPQEDVQCKPNKVLMQGGRKVFFPSLSPHCPRGVMSRGS